MDRMREDGLVLTDLAHKADGQLHGSSVWRLSPPKGQQLPFHRFNQVYSTFTTPLQTSVFWYVSRPDALHLLLKRTGGLRAESAISSTLRLHVDT